RRVGLIGHLVRVDGPEVGEADSQLEDVGPPPAGVRPSARHRPDLWLPDNLMLLPDWPSSSDAPTGTNCSSASSSSAHWSVPSRTATAAAFSAIWCGARDPGIGTTDGCWRSSH